jgi:hypothetical protein
MKTYTKLGYKLTEDDSFLDEEFGKRGPRRLQLKEQLKEIHISKGKPVVSKLRQLIKEHPDAPALKTYLAAAYREKGEADKARRQYEQLLDEYPNYPNGRIAMAVFLLDECEYDKIAEILGAEMDIRTAFPERKVFHLSEVSEFLRVSILYLVGTNQMRKAKARYTDLETLNSAYPELPFLLMYLTFTRFEKSFSAKRDQMEKLEEIFPQKRAEVSKNVFAPVFHHKEINNLYRYDAGIPQHVLQEILALPRASLIADLEKVLDDTVGRYDYFSQPDFQVEGNCFFALHAFFLLAELRAEESLSNVLSVLAYDDIFLDFWFGDYLAEDMWLYFYKTGFSRINEMKAFLLNPSISPYAKCGIIDAMVQTALHHPEKREEMIETYAGIIDYYLNLPVEDAKNIINTDFINVLINGALDGRFKSLLPQIKKLYDKEYVDTLFAENYKDVLNYINERINDKRDVKDICAIYQSAVNSQDKSLPDSSDEDDFEDDFEDEYDYDDTPIQPAVSVKIGRNDPCPCGSGKKYKKCCLTKE